LAVIPEAVAADPSLASLVALTRTPGLVDDVTQLDPASLGELERRARRSLISVPLSVPGPADRPAIGVIQLADRIAATTGMSSPSDADGAGAAPVFTAGDLKLAQALGGQAAILLENTRLVAFERELGIARTIQQNLLPGDPPQVDGLEVAGACQVASNVGGDYFDHVLVGDDRLGLLLADVSGHNLAAALIQTAVRSTFRAAMLADCTPVTVLARANEVLYEDLSRSELFLTAWLGFVDVNTRRLVFGDAGHHPALLYRAESGRVEQLSAGGVPVGVLLDGLYEQDEVQLEPGDVLVVYTDGLSEARASDDPKEEYGEERLISALRDVAHCSAAEIVEHLLGAVALFSGGIDPGDDRTLLTLKVIEADSR
jgi:serine phosphatase RsbU (regulator of sigma subunit)